MNDVPDEVMTEILKTKLSSPGFRIFPNKKKVERPISKSEKSHEKNKRAKISRKKNR